MYDASLTLTGKDDLKWVITCFLSGIQIYISYLSIRFYFVLRLNCTKHFTLP